MNLEPDAKLPRSSFETGASPPQPADQRYELSSDLVTLVDHRPEEAEAIRTVRTHIIARHLRDGRRGLAICAASHEVGCTFTAVNLAVALAQAGVATLLIDGDLRAPRLEQFIRPQAPAQGLRQCLAAADSHPLSYAHAEVIPNLSVLFAGGVAPDAQELLSGEPFRKLVERCLRDFEFTIIDTPPANACADALRISSVVGYSLIVARVNASRTRELAKLAQQLQDNGAAVVGTILSDT